MSSHPAWPMPEKADPAFPVLTQAQIDRIRPSGVVRRVEVGEILFRPHETDVPFFVLLSGKLEIVQSGLDRERSVVTHEPGSFTGELTMISGQNSLVTGRVSEAGEFLQLSTTALR